MRLDLLLRLLPLTLVPFVFSWLTGTPLRSLGLVITHPLRDLLVAIPAGIVGFGIAAAFNVYLWRRSGRWFVPTKPDLFVQSGYYLVLNAPIEEWFFRGFLQGSLARWWNAPLLGLLVATAIFGAYHFLDRWGWRPVAGATVAGLALATGAALAAGAQGNELVGRVRGVAPGGQQFQVTDRQGETIQVVRPARPPEAASLSLDGNLANTSALHEGDLVRLVESRPYSRSKRWRLVEVLERSR